MIPFDLEKALTGEPVKLFNGNKAYIMYVITNEMTPYRLRGYEADSFVKTSLEWDENGESSNKNNNIIGMWEEPRPQVTITIPAPLKEAPKLNSCFWIINIDYSDFVVIRGIWTGKTSDFDLLNAGRVFASEEDAEMVIEAIKEARQ